jgi:hypothetical protein
MGNNPSHSELALFLQSLIDDFATEYLDVYLVPNKDEAKERDGRHLRAAMNRNPLWYRRVCAAFPKRKQRPRKKSQSSVTKSDVIYIIQVIIRQGWSKSKYAPFILEEARRRYEAEFTPFEDQF